jgi:hypothetical protein
MFCSEWKVVLYVHGITGGSGMRQAFGYFEGSCRQAQGSESSVQTSVTLAECPSKKRVWV